MSSTFLRPPGFKNERHFLARCIRCNKCLAVCPSRSIRCGTLEDGLRQVGTPLIEPRRTPCYLCMECPPVCPTGALDPRLTDRRLVSMGVAVINRTACYAWQGTLCRSCYTICPFIDEAIGMDGQLRPLVNPTECVGCGMCEHVCPANPSAITVQPREAC